MKNTSCIFIHLLLVCNFSFAQEPPTEVTDIRLKELKGFSQTYYYSPGYEARANSIATLMENAVDFFHEEIMFTPETKMYILAPQHWKNFAAQPLHEVYGFPHNIDHVRLAVAAEDNDFWRSFLPPVDQLPTLVAAEVKNAYGNQDGSYSMMPFFDLLALHEMGHSYTAQAGLKMHRYWMEELFVNIMLHTYVAEKQPELLPALETFPNMVIGAGTTEFKFTSLEDFEKLYTTLGMGPKNYGWYQCRFHSAAKEIYNDGGKIVISKLWKALKTHQEDMTDKEYIEMLTREVHSSVADVYLKWNDPKALNN
jgi:hypothetical protein